MGCGGRSSAPEPAHGLRTGLHRLGAALKDGERCAPRGPSSFRGPKRRFSVKSSLSEEGLALPGLGWGKGKGAWIVPLAPTMTPGLCILLLSWCLPG